MHTSHVGHPITDLESWLQAVNSLRSDARSRGNLNKAILTFMFTDIEGSTSRWEADPAAMRAALDAHDLVLRGAIETNGGEVFACTGDGMCAVFASPRDAAEAATAAQRVLELPVRMGIGTGLAEHSRNNYFGTVLNRTARVMAAGHGGQILLDGASAALLNRADLRALGSRRLRDIVDPVDVFQLRAAGLPEDFPELRTAETVPGNITKKRSSFIGRAAETAILVDALAANRLVTLTGPGGVGKTRLATEVAAQISAGFSHGAWVVHLAAVKDPAAVRAAVAQTLGIEKTRAISAALKDQRRLIVLDNCEHVVDAVAELIDSILTGAPGVTILVTSREPLLMAAEQLVTVSPLDTDSAADLLVDRARAVGVELGGEHQDAVADICRFVDHLPLTIEMAAARLVSMTVRDLRDRLDDRLLVSARDTLAHHRSLRAAIKWSIDLLGDAERCLLLRCSACGDEFGIKDAHAISGSPDELTTVDLLDSLVRRSLLAVDRSTATTRFSMLRSVRRFVTTEAHE